MSTMFDQLQDFAQKNGFVKPKRTIEEQIKAINSIVKETKPIPDYRFTFGQYSGELLSDVLKKNKSYLQWLSQQSWVSDQHPQLCSILEDIL